MKQEPQIVICASPPSWDSDDAHWIDKLGNKKGKGYKSKKTGKIGLIRCPVCNHENYMLAVSSGVCYACGFNANEIPITLPRL